MNDLELRLKYAKVLRFAASKAWRKYHLTILRAYGEGVLFDAADIDQFALEGLMGLAGLMDIPGLGANKGKLLEIEARGGERWVQNSLDLYVAYRCHKLYRLVTTDKRGGIEADCYLDAPAGVEETFADMLEAEQTYETDTRGMTNLAAKYPILFQAKVLERPWREVAEEMGLKQEKYQQAQRAEIARLFQWGVDNRRLAA